MKRFTEVRIVHRGTDAFTLPGGRSSADPSLTPACVIRRRRGENRMLQIQRPWLSRIDRVIDHIAGLRSASRTSTGGLPVAPGSPRCARASKQQHDE